MRTSKYVLNKKPMSECSDKELKEVMSIARMHACRKGREHMADDFASYLMEDLLKQGYLNYNLNWRWAQFLRENVGNLKHKKGRAKAFARTTAVPIESLSDGASKSKLSYIVPVDPQPLPDTSEPSSHLAAKTKTLHERAVVVLKTKWGFTNAEVGEVLDVSPQRVAQIQDALTLRAKAKGWV